MYLLSYLCLFIKTTKKYYLSREDIHLILKVLLVSIPKDGLTVNGISTSMLLPPVSINDIYEILIGFFYFMSVGRKKK